MKVVILAEGLWVYYRAIQYFELVKEHGYSKEEILEYLNWINEKSASLSQNNSCSLLR